jgi:hypothetical protein
MIRFGLQSLNPLSWKPDMAQFPDTPLPEMAGLLGEARRRALLFLLIGVIAFLGFLGLAQYYRVSMKEIQRWNGDAGELLLLLGQARTQLETPLVFDELFYRRLGTIATRIDKLVATEPVAAPQKDSAAQKPAAAKASAIPGETRNIRTRADDVGDMLKAIVSEEKQFNRIALAMQQDRRFSDAIASNTVDSSILSQAARRAQGIGRETSAASPSLKLSLDFQPGLDYAWLRVAFNDRKVAAEEMTRELEENRASPQRRAEIEREKRLQAFTRSGDFVTTLDVFHTQRMQVLKLTENLPALSHAAAEPVAQGDGERSLLLSLIALLLLAFGMLLTAALQQLTISRRAAHAIRNMAGITHEVEPAALVRAEPIVSTTTERGPLLELVGQSGLTVEAFIKSMEELASAVSEFQAAQRSNGVQLRNAYLAGAGQFEQELAAVSSQGINLAMALANQADPVAMLESCDSLNDSIQALDAQLGSFLQIQAQRLETNLSRNSAPIDDSRSKVHMLASRLRQQLDAIATQLEASAEPMLATKRRAVSAKDAKDSPAVEVRISNGK